MIGAPVGGRGYDNGYNYTPERSMIIVVLQENYALRRKSEELASWLRSFEGERWGLEGKNERLGRQLLEVQDEWSATGIREVWSYMSERG